MESTNSIIKSKVTKCDYRHAATIYNVSIENNNMYMIVGSEGNHVQVTIGVVMSNTFYSWDIHKSGELFTVGTVGLNVSITPSTGIFCTVLKIS